VNHEHKKTLSTTEDTEDAEEQTGFKLMRLRMRDNRASFDLCVLCVLRGGDFLC
jgi:hypothetical protein